MRARILRGAIEIGGSCVELEAKGERLVLDLGRPLSSGFDEVAPLPRIDGLQDGADATLLGVLISHSHPDHYGLVDQVPEAVPMFIGDAASRILKEAAFFSPASLQRDWAGLLKDGEKIKIGPFNVTPLLVDHSAFDAFAFVVEADGRTLLYSGDLRGHGTDPETFERLLSRLPSPIHALLLEGTRVGREEADAATCVQSEADVEREVIRVCRETDGLVLAFYSAQNLERLTTLYWAMLNSPGRELVLDPYVEAVVAATGADDLPRVGLPRTRFYVPQSQRVKIKQAGEFHRIDRLREHRLFPEDLQRHPESFVLTFRPSMARELERSNTLRGAHLIWSMWPGYLREDRMDRFREFLDRNEIPISFLHASGHATVGDLQRVAEAAMADRVIPIHTAEPDLYPDFFANVEPHADYEWWSV